MSACPALSNGTDPARRQLDLERLTTDHPLERDDLGLVVPQQGGGFDVRIELAALWLGDPDADQVAREVVLARQPIEGRAGGVLLHDLLLEREAVDAMTCHEPYSCKAQLPGQSSAIVVSDLRGALHSAR